MKEKNLIFEGVATALITPFCDGRIDFDAFGTLIESQIESGIDALVVCGTTGESPSLSDNEKLELFAFARERSGDRVPIIAGVGCSDTKRTAKMCRAACEQGCDALLVVTPYYNRPTAEGLYRHYRACAEASNKPIIAYNVPARTGISIPVATLKRLSEEGLIAAVKEASGDLSRTAEIIAECEELTVYSGNDDQTLPTAALGGRGVISVTSNIYPCELAEMYRIFRRGEHEAAAKMQSRLTPIEHAIFSEVNPIGIKYAAALLGHCRFEYRLPLCEPTEATREKIKEVLKSI